MKATVAAVFVSLCCTVVPALAAPEPLRLAGRTELPGYTGDFDHFEYDLPSGRLWLAAEDHGTLDVFDLKTGALRKSLRGVVDTPHGEETIKGRLTVTGWALSPNGLSSVDVLLHNGMYRFHTSPTSRLDVKMKFPWYARVRDAGFTVTFPKRPRGVPQWTDVQVEIIDGKGGRTRLPDIVIRWP